MAFTTRDNDNDNRGGGNCAVDYSGLVVIPTIPIISDGDKLELSFKGVKTVVIRILLKRNFSASKIVHCKYNDTHLHIYDMRVTTSFEYIDTKTNFSLIFCRCMVV